MPEEVTVLLDELSGFEFEDFVAHMLNRLGYGHIEKILYSQDGGRDILIHSPNGLIIVECKHHSKGSIGRPVVQKLHSAVVTSKAVKGLLVTTGHFTEEALQYAANLAGSNAPIDMIDKPILADMASRANITLVSGNQKLIVWTYSLPSKAETEHALASYVATLVSSSPRHPIELLHNCIRVISYSPVYSITYDVESEFETSVGVVHRENVSEARLFLDGINGRQHDNSLSTFFDSEKQDRFSQPHEEYVGNLPNFQLDAATMQRMAKKTIIESHTTNVSYYGGNNQRYTKKCAPGERDVYISDVRQLYLPTTRLDFKLATTNYYIDGAQAPSGRLLSISDNLRTCKVCDNCLKKVTIICDVCGKTTHSGGFLIRSIHGFKCKRCSRTTCRNDGYWRRKYFFFKVLFCPHCFEESGDGKVTFRRFDDINKQTSSLWKRLFKAL